MCRPAGSNWLAWPQSPNACSGGDCTTPIPCMCTSAPAIGPGLDVIGGTVDKNALHPYGNPATFRICDIPPPGATTGASNSLHRYSWFLARSGPHRLPAHELWVENRSKHMLPGLNGVETHSKHLLPGPNGLEVHSKHLLPGLNGVETHSKHLLPGPNGLETDCCTKAFSNSLDLVIVCPACVLSGAWKLQLPRNHTREAFYSPQRASSVGLKLRLLLRPSRTRDSCRLGAASLACGSMFACLALRLVDTNVTKCVAYYS